MTRSTASLDGSPIKLGKVTLQVAHSPGQSPAIVFVHGGLGSRLNWCLQWDYFRSQGQEILTYDLAGHGQSGRYERYSVGRHRRDLTRLLQHFNIDRPILCCHSYGVPVGLEWARRHAATALIAIGGGTHNLTPWWEIPLIKFFAIGGHHLYRWQLVQELLRSQMASDANKPLLEFHDRNTVPTDAHPYEAIEAFWGYNTEHHPLKCPVTVITGGDDPMFPPAMGHEWLANLLHDQPQSQHITVSKVGHLIMAEAPEVVHQAISDWIT
ncbi:MAG: alpha/beta hydrolase [Phormidium tanganyikae FI6-MK23]|jgi:pimeloyl-ACP methyl ester carboxylesterase|nr:alpha/beta hydrolase [Phormidium tanganyikae FI6-MK23]